MYGLLSDMNLVLNSFFMFSYDIDYSITIKSKTLHVLISERIYIFQLGKI